MKLHELLESLHLIIPFEGPNPEIISIENDNRKVQKGSLFICIKGYTVDGHDFAQAAVDSGAAAIVAERPLSVNIPVIVVRNTTRAMAVLADAFYGQPSQNLHLIGITGTNGKTTTSHLIENILRDAGSKTGLIGTMYAKIGDEIIETKNTTPESLTLQKTFKQMVDAEVDATVMEVSSHALVVGRTHGTDFDIAVFTNLSQDHLDYHHTMEEYKNAKGLLFSQLGNAYNPVNPKFAILNADDAATPSYIEMTAAKVVTYGIDQDADILAKDIIVTANGTQFTLSVSGKEHKVSIMMAGKFNVYNVLASIATGLVSGIPIEGIIETIQKIEGVSGRFELVKGNQDFSVIVDYAHTPDSLENVLKTIQQFAEKRVFVVVGCGGDRDKTKRPLMAKIACEYGTDAIFTADNPRSEDPLAILKDMEAGVIGEKYISIPDRTEAIECAIKEAKSGDVILIAGKGHETYQDFGDKVIDFDDREVAKKAIAAKLKQ
ncbi:MULTISPECIES: UDP-N-acetylmuramoyl-L-alanyl-D-glutamate--2,6-diaminopimelate ligase [unclassified Bacillus (in: firmicutes)]|uniref:UDP-N-acetylmuramoyl-L-alanyl-D-glutamate--2, 6-diaminopimelate ligase n=1 Tax=unclassified Bacillus (in: firmicutes) TaxID=185979 RepID=UPI0008EF275B|nr:MULTISPECIES: UDP-N-acetylmuramoyl-L-alanyl-D-glutamate--2,6-diaminopimelate ligase [unclassified Bacillus (in: firmicutes)]SFA75524.1 UDP-N-acetylmuramoylalanyl-D-glutamate--2,6-diaminopimelate ligase [Bacillus sp. UNCCL13]SFQ65620.1 UDP-N-acetylmuramoylalanyl-D-glutamate--2,6-diaminopimelate ligase [Bacillus sp. cl95]